MVRSPLTGILDWIELPFARCDGMFEDVVNVGHSGYLAYLVT